MFLAETVSDQAVLGHQPASCPACPSLVFWAMHRTPGEHLACFPPCSRSECPSPTWGSAQVTRTSSPQSHPSCLPSCKCYYELLGKALGPLPLKPKLIKITINTCSVKETKLWPLLCALIQMSMGKRASAGESSVYRNHSSSLLSVYAKYSNSTGPQAARWEWPIPSKDPRLTLALVFPGTVGEYGHLSG